MLDPRLISTVPLLCVLACTASYPEALDKPDELVIADDLDAAPSSRPPRTPGRGAAATSDGTIPFGNTGLVWSGGSTSQAEPGGYSGSRGFENFGGRGTRVPTVRQAKSEVVGELDKDLIRRTVRTHIHEVRRCYDKALARDPNAKGRVSHFVEWPTPLGVVGTCLAGHARCSVKRPPRPLRGLAGPLRQDAPRRQHTPRRVSLHHAIIAAR